MTQPDPATAPSAPTGPDLARVRRILAVARRVGTLLLSSGAQTTEVEVALRRLTSDLGLEDVQVGVFYSSIQLSYVEPGDFKPTTIVQMASDRTSDFTRLSDVTSLLRRVSSGELDLEGAESTLTGIEQDVRHGPRWLAFLAPAVSSGALAILLGGAPIDAAATFVIALIVQPVVRWLKRSGTPPFFSLLLGTAAATVLAALTARLGFGVDVGLLMAASLIQFLPGGALLAGVRDLIDQAVVSGTARLSEALLIAAGVASGAILGIALSARLGVTLAIEVAGPRSWDPVIAMIAAAIAVAAYAYQVAVPTFALAWVAVLGAMAWSLYALMGYSPELGTFVAAVAVGAAGRLLARHYQAPATLWVVPAILPLLPGLALVVALLAPSDAQRFSGLWGAILIAFALGVGVAAGDIMVAAIHRVRRRVVEPAVRAAATGIGVLVLPPVEETSAGDDEAAPGRSASDEPRVEIAMDFPAPRVPPR